MRNISNTATVCLRLSQDRVAYLKGIARKISYESKHDVSYLDLIREALDEAIDRARADEDFSGAASHD